MTRDELVELMIANDAFLGELPDVQSHTILQAALRSLEAAGCQIVQGEAVAFMVSQMNGIGPRELSWQSGKLSDRDIANEWTETPLFAGKVQP